MRVLLASNAPNVPSAYGQQTGYLVSYVGDIEFAVASLFGVQGGMMNIGGLPIYPAGGGRAGDGNVWAAEEHFRPDAILSFYDAWPLRFPGDERRKTPWISWTTVDSRPLDKRSETVLKMADGIVAYSRFGRDVLEESGFENVNYIPCGIPTDVFTIHDKTEAKRQFLEADGEELSVPIEDIFLVGMVGRNNTTPSRKGFDVGMMAFKQFAARHDNAYLYLHTDLDQTELGVDIRYMAEQLGIGHRLLYCDQARNRLGFPHSYMVGMYNALDVLLQPSQAEGFGIPIIEAMACGTPAIATEHSSMIELLKNAGGWLVPGQPMYTPKGAWFLTPAVDEVLVRLEAAYVERFNRPQRLAVRRALGREFVVSNYDFPTVVAPMWKSYLEGFFAR